MGKKVIEMGGKRKAGGNLRSEWVQQDTSIEELGTVGST